MNYIHNTEGLIKPNVYGSKQYLSCIWN